MDVSNLTNFKNMIYSLNEPNLFEHVPVSVCATTKDQLAHLIEQINRTPDGDEFDNLIKTSYSFIFQAFRESEPECMPYIAGLFSQIRFISGLIKVLCKLKSISDIDITTCNHIYYDYMTQPRELDPRVSGLYLTLAKTVNKPKITALLGRGVDEELATRLAAAANSSEYYPELNIRRLNWLIVREGPDIMTVSMIRIIYQILVPRMGQLLSSTMTDTYYIPESQDSAAISYVNNNINTAILTELNEMPMTSIYEVLKIYANDYACKASRGYTDYRFSFKNIDPTVYPRIMQSLYTAYQNGIMVP